MRPSSQTLRFYRPFIPLFGGIFFCLLGVGASLATLPFFVLRNLHGRDRKSTRLNSSHNTTYRMPSSA